MTSTQQPAADAMPAAPAVSYASVLVPLDGSEEAERALAVARRFAGRFGATLHAVAADVQRDERWWYQGYFEKLRDRLGELTPHVSDELAVPAIVGTARELEPSLVCMATHGRARSAAIVGSTFARVAARRQAPLVAIGPRVADADDAPDPADRLVVCLDGNKAAERALPLAAGWARRFGWRVSIVTAADPVLLPRDYGFDPDEYLRGVADRPDLAGLEVDTQVLWGIAYPHVCIGQHLDGDPADLVVATTHARTGVARAALGSEAARIIHRSPAPVLVSPPPPQ